MSEAATDAAARTQAATAGPLAGTAPGGAGARSEGEGHLARGTLLGRYLIVGPLGAGGMGTVYAAFDPELDRKVAIKLLDRAGAADANARLLREAQAMAKIVHPNVITVHDVGTIDRQVFVAMELVEGPTLRRWLTGESRWRRALAVMLAAGRGLAAAHAAGLVHRDFKPKTR